MALKWTEVVQYAKRHGVTEKDLRRRLAERGVTKGTVTNWKGGRPVPPAQYATIAGVIGGSVDEMIGRGVRDTVLIAPRDDAAALLAAEITKLEPQLRDFLTTMVEVLVARQKRGGRKRLPRVPPELHDS